MCCCFQANISDQNSADRKQLIIHGFFGCAHDQPFLKGGVENTWSLATQLENSKLSEHTNTDLQYLCSKHRRSNWFQDIGLGSLPSLM